MTPMLYNHTNFRGMSLVELLVAMGIGSVLMLGLATTFKNSSDTAREMERSGRLIENGRYAVDLLATELHHAGYYGHYYENLTTPAALPDPCEIGSTANISSALAMPLQGYTAASLTARPDISATTCDNKNLFITTNLKAGSDIIAVRRASTAILTGNPVTNEVYIQANPRDAEILLGNASASVPTQAANNAAQTMKKFPFNASSTDWADTRKYHTSVYFIAPCSFGTGTNEVCSTADDTIPTLKRLELSSNGTNTEMNVVPLVEGVEYMKVTYGIDTSPATVNLTTGFAGDGIPDSYVATPTLAQWPLVVAVRIYLLVRSPAETQGYVDTKTYKFAIGTGLTLGPFDDAYRRHVYTTEIRPMNLAGRREVP